MNLVCLLQMIGVQGFHANKPRIKQSRLFALNEDKHVQNILFVECGFGADAHGQDSTKAAGEWMETPIPLGLITFL